MRRIGFGLTFLVLLALAIALQSLVSTPALANEKVQVVTTLGLLADWVKAVGGPYVEVTSLVPGRETPHTFEPTIKHIQLLQGADLFIEIGLDLETWSDKLIQNAGKKGLTRLIVAEKLPPTCKFGPLLHKLGTQRHSQCNPHLWLDSPDVTRAIPIIAEYLSMQLPQHEGYFTQRALEYQNKIDELFAKYKTQLPSGDVAVVSTVPTYTFLFREYGITEVGPLTDGHGEKPSAKDIVRLVEEAKKQKAHVVVSEEGYDHDFGRVLAEETGLPLLYLNPLPLPGQDYLSFMEDNLSKLVQALR